VYQVRAVGEVRVGAEKVCGCRSLEEGFGGLLGE